jgi:hypothetical protein
MGELDFGVLLACEATTHHRFDVRMWYSVELVVFEFQVRTDVDVRAFVFRAVAVLGCRED